MKNNTTQNSKKSEARKWVWIRGLARHSAHWSNFEESFRKKFPHDLVEKIDCRGNGNQAHSPSFISIDENVRDLRARSTLAQQGPIHLLTISLGSMIGIQWAHLFPQDIASLTVINTSEGRFSKPYERLRPGNYKKILDTVSKSIKRSVHLSAEKAGVNADNSADNFEIEMNLMAMIAQNVKNKEEVAREFAKHPPTSAANLVRQLIAASRFRLPENPPPMPLLMLASRGDGFVNPVCSERIARAWKQKIVWHDSAGHDIPLESPDWVAEQMDHFLNRKT